MAFAHMELFSLELMMNTCVNVVLPDIGNLREARVVTLLHGLSDNASGWCRYTACERYAKEKNLVLIMPEVQRSFYMDCARGLPYYTYISQELPRNMERIFSLSSRREDHYIMGLSMGGFGALKCALNHPETYAGAAAFSAVTDLRDFFSSYPQVLFPGEIQSILGESLQIPENSDLVRLLKKNQPLPPIYLSCGEQDLLYGSVCRFEKALTAAGVSHRFDHRPGDHTWDFWDQSLRDALQWFLK